MAPRVLATLVAGGALAAAGQTALTAALPTATDGITLLTSGVRDLASSAPTAAAPTAGLTLVSSSSAAHDAPAAEPRVADVSDLVKAADLHARAAENAARRETTARAAAEAAARAATAARTDTADEARPPVLEKPERAEPDPAPSDVPTGELRVVAGEVTSGFGARWGARHNGIDIAAPVGTPIFAPLAGDVVDSGPASGFGLWVRVRHDDGTVTTYGHVNRALAQVGDRVAAGQEIAEVGNRGHSTGPHLHMEVQTPAGTTVNPRPWLDGHGIAY